MLTGGRKRPAAERNRLTRGRKEQADRWKTQSSSGNRLTRGRKEYADRWKKKTIRLEAR